MLELWVRLQGGQPVRIAADRNDRGATYHDDMAGKLGTYRIVRDSLIQFLDVPGNVEYVAVRMPWNPTLVYEPHLMGYRHRIDPFSSAGLSLSGQYPGKYHAPLTAACGPNGGALLGCPEDRTVTVAATHQWAELRFPAPKPYTTAKILVAADPAAVQDVGPLLDDFRMAWDGKQADAEWGETEALAIGINAQDVANDKLELLIRGYVSDYAGLCSTAILWGQQDDPGRGCCQPIIPWRNVASYAADILTEANWSVLPYIRPDGADFAAWMKTHNDHDCSEVYIDHVAGCTPEQIRGIPEVARYGGIIEWPTLALPGFSVLASGCIHGGKGSFTWPDGTPRPENPNLSTWPDMGRHLFPRTKFWLGTQNGLDASWWGLPDGTATGEPKRFAHATERAAFRLGMGLIPCPAGWREWQQEHPGEPCPAWSLNACTDAIMGAWYASRFLYRQPKWAGVVDNNPLRYVTAFDCSDGKRLHCIDEWSDTLKVGLSIVEVA